ncbi:MAG: hypothetical protein ABMB14_20025 [Myxococcota bacterium]
MAEQRSEASEIAMLVFVLAPVTGAMFSGPIVGLTLMSLALGDTILIAVSRFL